MAIAGCALLGVMLFAFVDLTPDVVSHANPPKVSHALSGHLFVRFSD
jgi:hypothetical protein